jgi:hypothetical protein
MRPLGVTGRMVAASVLLVAAVAVVFAVLLAAIGDLRGSTRWTDHSVAVLGAAAELQNDLGDFSSASATSSCSERTRTTSGRNRRGASSR